MSEAMTFFDVHVADIRKDYPDTICPVIIARHVLERMGIDSLSNDEFTQFTQDLKLNNLRNNHHTDAYQEREIA